MSKKWTPEKWRSEFPGLVAVSTTLGHALSSSLVAEEHWTPAKASSSGGIKFRAAEQLAHGLFYVELDCRPSATDGGDFSLKLSLFDMGVFQPSSKFKPNGVLKLVSMEYQNSDGKWQRLTWTPLRSQLQYLGLEFFSLDDQSFKGHALVVRETTPDLDSGVRVMLKRELQSLVGTTIELDSDMHWHSNPRSFDVFHNGEFNDFSSYVLEQAKAKGHAACIQLLMNSREHGVPVMVPSGYAFE